MRAKYVLVAAALAAALALDRPAYDFLHGHFNKYLVEVPSALRLPTQWMRAFGKCGESLFGFFLGAAMWQLAPRRRGQVFCLAVASLSTVLLVEIVKRTAGRQRPDVSHGATVFDGFAHLSDSKAEGHSFPSGHAAAAGCYGAVVSALAPPMRGMAMLAAVGVGASRMHEERHYLSDCLAGGLLGWWIGAFFARNLWLKKWWDALGVRLAPRKVGEAEAGC